MEGRIVTDTLQLLSAEQIARYQTDGYLVIDDLLTEDEVNAFVRHLAQEEAVRTYGLHGHLQDPQYRYLATHPKIAGTASQILGGQVRVVQTMLLNKPSQGGKGIALHQDSHYLPNEPNTLMACWLALTDTDPENGGLCVVPGSHRQGLRAARKNEDDAEHVTWETVHTMRDRDGREWSQTLVSFQIADVDPAQLVRLTVPRGGGVFFTGMTVHGSFANQSATRPRTAWAVHYVHEGTWLYRGDVQDAMLVEQGSTKRKARSTKR
jgi:ectoine hydroxylase-related dioxygenase (phytanoyl-CoA dioxygenase family)